MVSLRHPGMAMPLHPNTRSIASTSGTESTNFANGWRTCPTAQSAQDLSTNSGKCIKNVISAGGAEFDWTRSSFLAHGDFRRRRRTLFCHTAARNDDAGSDVYSLSMFALLAISRESLMHRWKVGLAPAKSAYPKQRRRALVVERQARRRQRGITAVLSRLERSAQTAAVPLAVGPALIVILLLSLGFWGVIWAAMALAVSALG